MGTADGMWRVGVWLSRLRIRLLLLVLIAALPALALLLYTANEQRREATREAEISARHEVRLVTSLAERSVVEATRDVLGVMAQVPAVRRGDVAACRALAARLVGDDPRYANVGVVDPEGRWICSGLPVSPGLAATDRSWFQQAVRTRAFTVGEYETAGTPPKPGLAFGYPLVAQEGERVRGVIYAVVDLEWLARVLSAIPVPEGGSLTVADRRGTVLARHPDGHRWVGRSIPEASLLAAIRDGRHEGITEEPGPDDRRQLITFARPGSPLDDGALYVSLAFPADVAFAKADRILARGLLGIGSVTALALLAGLLGGEVLLRRRVARLVAVTKRLATGDLSARTGVAPGPGELGELTRAVDEMADALERVTQQHQLILASVNEGIYQVDRTGRISFANLAASSLSGYSVSDLMGRCLATAPLHSPPDVGAGEWEASPLHDTLATGARRHVDGEVMRRPDGTIIPIEYTSAPIRERSEIVGAVIAFREVTDRRRAEAALRRSHEQLRRLSEHLQTALEQERTRIAREVHDELGQALTGLKIDLAWVRERVTRSEDGRAASVPEKLTSMANLADATIDSLRRLTSELRPPALDYLGLVPAIEGQAQAFQRRTGIRCRVRTELERIPLDTQRSTGVFRIIQEALTNVARHAHASRVDVQIQADAEALTFEVRDNGRGITQGEAENEQSLGLLGMRERARLVGGEVAIVGGPQQGTAIILRIPVAGDGEEAG